MLESSDPTTQTENVDVARQSIIHAARQNLGVRLSNSAYGWVMNVLFHPAFSPQQMRRNFEFFAATSLTKLQRRFARTEFRALTIGPVRAESITTVPNPTRRILYLHGGGYVFGSIATYRRRAIKLSYRCRAEVILPEYRLAPEHPFPAALDDAMAAWKFMASGNSNQDSSRDLNRTLYIAGDSAGGGLALSLATTLRNRDQALPSGVIALSPWTDLTLTGASMLFNRDRDCWLKRDQLTQWCNAYRGTHDTKHPLISPLHAELAGLPPLLLLAGDQEILLDDTRRFAQKARQAGVSVRDEIGVGMQHDWPLTLPWLKASARAWNVIAHFVEECDRALDGQLAKTARSTTISERASPVTTGVREFGEAG